MNKLKRCPFCGGEAFVAGSGHWIACKDCLAESDFYDYEYEAIEAWNTRKPMERIVEHLEEELKLADEEKRRCVAENMLQFDSAKGYANGIYNAIEIVKEEGGLNEKM